MTRPVAQMEREENVGFKAKWTQLLPTALLTPGTFQAEQKTITDTFSF